MLNIHIDWQSAQSQQKDNANCYITPSDIVYIKTKEEVTRSVRNIIERGKSFEMRIKSAEIEIGNIIGMLEILAVNKLWEDRGNEWFIEKVWWLWDRLKNTPWIDCQKCACWHLISWWSLPVIENIDILDFEWENSILKFLIREYSYLVSLETLN